MNEQNSRVLEKFSNSNERNSKNITLKNQNVSLNNQPRRYFKTSIILVSQNKFKKKNNQNRFSEHLGNENSRVLEKFSSIYNCTNSTNMDYVKGLNISDRTHYGSDWDEKAIVGNG